MSLVLEVEAKVNVCRGFVVFFGVGVFRGVWILVCFGIGVMRIGVFSSLKFFCYFLGGLVCLVGVLIEVECFVIELLGAL